MDAKQLLIMKMLAQRELWVELEPAVPSEERPAVEVCIRRPAEAEVGEFMVTGPDGKPGIRASLDQVKKYVTNWRGFSEATLVGGAVGSSDPVEFVAEAWGLFIEDNIHLVPKVAEALVDSIVKKWAAKDAAAKNSQPISTVSAGSNGRAKRRTR